MRKRSYYIINALTWYRIAAAPILIVLVLAGQLDWFKWLLALSFFTDLIDGMLARKFNVETVGGSKLDSIGDDLTVAAALTGLFVFRLEFIREEKIIFIVLLSIFIIQTVAAFIRYGKMTSFHTYLAKTAAILQGCFLILAFLLPEPVYLLFYTAAFVTGIELIEETVLVFILPEWKTNVKGLYWALKKKDEESV